MKVTLNIISQTKPGFEIQSMCCFQVQFLVNKTNTPYNGSTDYCKKTIIQDVIKTMEYIKVFIEWVWPYDYKLFEHYFVLISETKAANQCTVSSKYFVSIGQYLSMSTKIHPSRDGPYYVIGYGGRQADVHTDFRTITLVLYIGSLPNLATWFPCGRGRTLFIMGSLGQRSRSPLL